jgi:hypothetical protein
MLKPELPRQEDLAEEIREHLRLYSPKAYKRMKADKTLELLVTRRAEDTLSYMRTLVRQGLDSDTAWSTAMRSIGLVELDET